MDVLYIHEGFSILTKKSQCEDAMETCKSMNTPLKSISTSLNSIDKKLDYLTGFKVLKTDENELNEIDKTKYMK